VLQYVAVCCSLLQFVAVRCSVLHCTGVKQNICQSSSSLHVSGNVGVLQRVAMYYSVL